MVDESNIYRPLAIKFYSFSLCKLNDYNWTGCNLFDHVKCAIRQYNGEPEGLLRRVLKRGLLFQLSCWLYKEYLDAEYPAHIDTLKDDYLLWYLEDVIDFLKFHGALENSKTLSKLITIVEKANAFYEIDERKYFMYVNKGKQKYTNTYREVFKIYKKKYFEKLKARYASVLANRLFHDTTVCEYISQILLIIGFDGSENIGEPPKKWINRPRNKPPSWVKEILLERENYKCAECKKAFNFGENKSTIDHIVPLSKGGCNDLVNLQLLCTACNQKKQNDNISVNDSIPDYFGKYWTQPHRRATVACGK